MAINKITLESDNNEPTHIGYPVGRHVYEGIEWGSPIPLPYGRKFSPPTGVTGKLGVDASDERQKEFDEQYPTGETAVRLAPFVAALDVDTYDDKTGYDDILKLENELGDLPRGPISSKRGEPLKNGKRLFTIPEGMAWEDPSDSVEIVHSGWRYVIAYPSVIDGLEEKWWFPNADDDGYHIEDRAPRLEEIPSGGVEGADFALA